MQLLDRSGSALRGSSRIQLPPLEQQLLEEGPAIADHNTRRDHPLGMRAVSEQHRADHLDQREGEDQIGDPDAGTGHEVPAALEAAGALTLFIAPQGRLLEQAEREADDPADQETGEIAKEISDLI